MKEQEEWGISNIVQSSYGADLGMFKFDEDLAKDLGTTIVIYSLITIEHKNSMTYYVSMACVFHNEIC